jgi:hypothetical protein
MRAIGMALIHSGPVFLLKRDSFTQMKRIHRMDTDGSTLPLIIEVDEGATSMDPCPSCESTSTVFKTAVGKLAFGKERGPSQPAVVRLRLKADRS